MIPYHLLLACFLLAVVAATKDDLQCLKGVKATLSDPNGSLNWDFSNVTEGFVCNFRGVSCWHAYENRILSLYLTSMSLSGHIPSALQYCHSINTLDLSDNTLSGSIPVDLCSWLPYLVSLDLSTNQFTGPIPPDLSGCKYLNILNLAGNQFSGTIPNSLGSLSRLHYLSLSNNQFSGTIPNSLGSLSLLDYLDLSNNQLSGPLPPFLSDNTPTSSFSHLDLSNQLSGPILRPLNPFPASFSSNPAINGAFGGRRHFTGFHLIVILGAGILGTAASILAACAVWCLVHRRQAVYFEDGRHWVERLRSSHNLLVSVWLFRKPIIKVKLGDLLAATEDFHPDNIITASSRNRGTCYKAVLSDGSALTLRRLSHCSTPLSDEPFRSEMVQISQLHHPNLACLLGFCIVEDERLLIYKYMPNGTLSHTINSLEWPSRLRIGVAAARGLTWLHHGFLSPFLHRSFSSSSILLDEDNEPRITDLGLVNLTSSMSAASDEYTDLGYLAPEYAISPIATTKGDVYAFGVVLLELVTGQKPTQVTSNISGEVFKGNWVNQLSFAGRIRDVIDRSLWGRGHEEEITQFVIVACECIVASPVQRPSMYQIYDSLKSIAWDTDIFEYFDEFPFNYHNNLEPI